MGIILSREFGTEFAVVREIPGLIGEAFGRPRVRLVPLIFRECPIADQPLFGNAVLLQVPIEVADDIPVIVAFLIIGPGTIVPERIDLFLEIVAGGNDGDNLRCVQGQKFLEGPLDGPGVHPANRGHDVYPRRLDGLTIIVERQLIDGIRPLGM